MRRYRLPGFQSRLLLELQRQQNNALFCDTLLQTEDVSVPAHGCVLAALSPYLSRKLSASPNPPAGQQRKVKLQAVNAQTLLKLVGLSYSGQLEVNETADRDDVLAAAVQLGFDHLAEGQEDVSWGEWAGLLAEERKEREKRVTCDAAVQVETKAKTRDAETQGEATGFGDAATQTTGAPSDVWASSSPRDTPLPGALGPGAAAAAAALLDETGLSKEVTKTTTTTSTTSTESSAPRSTRVSSELSHCVRPTPASLQRKAGTRETAEGGRKKEEASGQSTQTKGKEMRKRRGKLSGGSRRPARGSSQTREIAIKVKLRRVEQGATWEVVHMRDMGQRRALRGSQAVFTALNKDRAKLLRAPAKGTRGRCTASTSQPGAVTKQQPNPAASLGLPGHPPRIEVFTDPQALASLGYTPESSDSMSALLSQAQCPVEESDREIEKLLEDIMMGLNILPPSSGLEKDGNRSGFRSTGGAAVPSAPPALDWTARQGEVDAAANVGGSQGYKTLWEDASSKDTVLHSRSSSCLVPTAASAPSFQCADTWLQIQSQSNQIAQAQSSLAQEQSASKDSSPHQSFTQCNSLNHKRQGGAMEQIAPHSEPLECQSLRTLNGASIASDTVKSCGLHTDQPAFKELTWLSSTLQALQFPLSLGFKADNKPSEPADPSSLESLKGQELLESSRRSTGVMQKKRMPPVKKLCVKAAKEKMQPSDRKSLTGPIAPCGKAPQSKDPPLKQCDTKDKPVTSKRKRKCEAHTDDAPDRTSGYKVTRHGDGEFSQIFLNVCSVSLSCNNVLSKKSTLKLEPPLSKKPQEVLNITAVDKGFKKSKADQTITETRKKSTLRARSASITKDKGDEIVENVPVIKRKRGRPKNIKTVPHDANPSTDKILESDRKTNLKAEIGEKCGPTVEKLQRKCRKIIRNVPISNDKKCGQNVLPSCAVSALEPEGSPPRVDEEQLCAQQRDPETIEHTTCSENTHTADGKLSGNLESSVNPAVKPAEAKRTPTVSLKDFKELIKFRHIKTRGSQTKTTVKSSEVGGNDSEATSAETLIGVEVLPTKNINYVKFDQIQNRVVSTESQKSPVDITVLQDKKGDQSQGQKGKQVPLGTEDKKEKDYNIADIVVKAFPLVGQSSSIARKVGDQCIAQYPGHSAASETSRKPETIQPRPTVEPVMGLKKSDNERWVEADDLSSKDIGFHSNKGEEETSEMEREEMVEVVLDGGPGEERLVERPDEALDLAQSTKPPQDPVEDFTPCRVSPAQQSNTTKTDCPITPETPSTPRAASASKTKHKGDEIVENVPVIKRKRGRPKNIKTVPHDANPSADKILESDRKTNVKAEIGEKCGPNEGKLRRKCRKVVRNVPISNDEVHDDVQSSDTILPSCAVSALEPEGSPPRVDEEQLCAQQRDPETIETNEHTTCSENTHTADGKTPTVLLKEVKELLQFRHVNTSGSQTKTKVKSSEVGENVHLDGKACEYTDRCEATSSENIIPVISTESQKSPVDITVSQDKKGDQSQGQKGKQVPLGTEDKKGKDYNIADIVVKAFPLVGQSSSIAIKVGDQCIAQYPGHSAASETSGKPETIQPRPTVEPVMGLKKSDNERWVEADDLSSKDIGFHSNKGEEETSEMEREEMVEVVLDGGPGEERLVERPDEALDLAQSTEPPQDPVEDFTRCRVSPAQQSNTTKTDCPITPETPNRRSQCIKGSRHSQEKEEEEEEEEMEVDILLCSPDKGREPIDFGARVVVDTSPDEDEEELKEIDVIGI